MQKRPTINYLEYPIPEQQITELQQFNSDTQLPLKIHLQFNESAVAGGEGGSGLGI